MLKKTTITMTRIYKIKGSKHPVALIIIEVKGNIKLININIPYTKVMLHFILTGYYLCNFELKKFAGKLKPPLKQLEIF